MNNVIAQRSTRGSGAFRKKRWVEIRLIHSPDDDSTPFTIEIRKCSEHDGERTILTRHRARTLRLALDRLDNTAPARSIADQARVWDEGGRVAVLERAHG